MFKDCRIVYLCIILNIVWLNMTKCNRKIKNKIKIELMI